MLSRLRLVVVDPLGRQVAVDLPSRSVVSEAVAAGSARLADAAHEPLFRYVVGVVDSSLGILVMLSVFLYLPSEVLEHLPLVLIALVVVVNSRVASGPWPW